MKFKNLFIIALAFLLAFCCYAQDASETTPVIENPKVKVGINFGSSALTSAPLLTSDFGFQVGKVAQDGSFLWEQTLPHTTIFISTGSNNVLVLAYDGTVIYEVGDKQELIVMPNPGTAPIPFTKVGSIQYPGILKFSASNARISVINIVDAELYFKGVLPSEVYPNWHPEALKAAAIATRTYTYQSISGKHSDFGVDLCATTCCQVYSGITKYQDSTNNAVDSTRNMVLTYNGGLITAVYHAISGGVTESAAGAWGGSIEQYPYLSVVETPFERYEEIAKGRWNKVIYPEDLQKLIEASSSFKDKITSSIADITIVDTTPGYLNNVTLTDNSGNSITLKTSSQVRSFFSTISANFTIGHVFMPSQSAGNSTKVLSASGTSTYNASSPAVILTASGKETVKGIKSALYLDGKGYGHGVGLSQYGAQYAAKLGFTYDQILSIYYPKTTIQDYSLMLAAQQQQ